MKRPADQRRKLPPELEAFARSDDEKLRIRRPRVDQGRVRDPREGYTVAGVSNRDARAVYDVRTEAMRTLWAGGEADDEARATLGQLFHEALRLELWHARRLTSFAALAEEVVGVPAAKAEALAEAHAALSGEPLTPLTERAIALWLRTEAGLYEGDEGARARIVSRSGTLLLELSVELAHASTALAGVGARHLPLARSREADEGERRPDARDHGYERRPRDDERRTGERRDDRRHDGRPGLREDSRRNEAALRAVAVLSGGAKDDELEELRESEAEPAYRVTFDGRVDDAAEEAVDDDAADQADADTGVDALADDGLADDALAGAGLADDANEENASEGAPPAQGLGGTRLLTRKSRLDGESGARDERTARNGAEEQPAGRSASGGDRPRFVAGERRERPAFRAGATPGQGGERARSGGFDRSAFEGPARSGREPRPRFTAERASAGGNAERPRFSSDRPRFGGKDRAAAGGSDKPRFGADRGGRREERPRFGADRGADGPSSAGNREARPRLAGDRGAFGARFGADRGSDTPRFGGDRGERRSAGGGNERNAGAREDRPRFGNDRGRAPGAREDRPRFGNDRGRAAGGREDRPRFGNDRGRTGERPKQGGFGDRNRGPQPGKFGNKAKPGVKGGKGFGARQPFGQKDKASDGGKAREPRRADDDDNLE